MSYFTTFSDQADPQLGGTGNLQTDIEKQASRNQWILGLKRSSYIVLCLLIFSPFAGCNSEQAESDLDFGVFRSAKRYSLLDSLHREGAIHFCLEHVNGNVNPTTEEKIDSAIRKAVKGWNDLLITSKSSAWDRESITVEVEFVEGEACDSKGSDVTISLWRSAEDWKNRFGSLRSHALIQDRKINLNSRYAYPTQDSIDFVIRHEYGHLLGLGDTYHSKTSNPVHQPPSTMRERRGFTDDDRVGINAVWRYIHSDILSCDTGYTESIAERNGFSQFFCVPEEHVCKIFRDFELRRKSISHSQYSMFKSMGLAPGYKVDFDATSGIDGWYDCSFIARDLAKTTIEGL